MVISGFYVFSSELINAWGLGVNENTLMGECPELMKKPSAKTKGIDAA